MGYCYRAETAAVSVEFRLESKFSKRKKSFRSLTALWKYSGNTEIQPFKDVKKLKVDVLGSWFGEFFQQYVYFLWTCTIRYDQNGVPQQFKKNPGFFFVVAAACAKEMFCKIEQLWKKLNLEMFAWSVKCVIINLEHREHSKHKVWGVNNTRKKMVAV